MSKFIDLIGQKFGRLMIIELVGKNRWGKDKWLCKCDCGQEKIVLGNSLKSGNTKSCGCLSIEKTKQRLTKHGHNIRGRTSLIYKSWKNMIQRCTNANNKDYHRYGGRGIMVCRRWRKFPNFLKDMGKYWEPGLTLERKNNYKGYSNVNCYWANKKQQARNRRDNHLVKHNGKEQCIAAWSEKTGISEGVIRYRLKVGWSVEKTLMTPVRKIKKIKQKCSSDV